MSAFYGWIRAGLSAFLLVFIVFLWVAFAPIQVGGQAAYVAVAGSSMEPGFHFGDLVIVRRTPTYRRGDSVVYTDPNLGRYVFHRIIGEEQGHFILQGDNNTWIDSYRPAQDEIIGKLWLHLPKTGKLIQWVRQPLNFALLAGIMGTVLIFDNTKKTPTRKGGKNMKPAFSGGFIEGVSFGLGLLAFTSLLLGVFAFTRPLMRTADEIPYQHQGAFSYSAIAPSGIYDTPSVQTGDPIFTQLTCSIDLGFLYTFNGGQPQELSGSHQIIAEISDDQSGWRRTLLLEPKTAFTGNAFSTQATLNLCQLQKIAEAVELETGLHTNSYKLSILAQVNISGQVSAAELLDTFEPSLVFRFDKVHFYLVKADVQVAPGVIIEKDTLKNPRLVNNSISLLGLKPTVFIVRSVAAGGFGISLIGILILATYIYSVSRRSQNALARMKYGSMLVDVQTNGFEMRPTVVQVATMDELAKLAEKQNSIILHYVLRGNLHFYFVQSEKITYRYVSQDGENSETDEVGRGKAS